MAGVLSLAFLMATAVGAAAQSAVPFQNGSFEDNGGDGSTSVPGWTLAGPGVSGATNARGATDGSYAVLFNYYNSATGGTLAQTFATVAGQQYVVRFDFGALAAFYESSGPQTSLSQLQVEVRDGSSSDAGNQTIDSGSGTILTTTGGSLVANGTAIQVKDETGVANAVYQAAPSAEFSAVSFTFTAQSTVSTIVFTDQSAGGADHQDLVVDNVQLIPPPVVEFSVASERVSSGAGTLSVQVTINPPYHKSTFAFGFDSPGLAVDAAGNLYLDNYYAGTVSRVTPAGVVSTFASGFTGPAALAFDAAGNLYVANSNSGTVSQVTPAGVVSTFASGFAGPAGLAFDAAGNLYVANSYDNTVSRVTPAGAVSPFASGLDLPNALAFDADGDLYVANISSGGYSGTVSKVTPTGAVSQFASGLYVPKALAFDAAGHLYVASFYGGTVNQVTPAGVVIPFASGFDYPTALAFDAAGNLYVTNYYPATVSKVTFPPPATVPFSLGGSAVAGIDYTGVTASPLIFATGQSTATITGTLLPRDGASKTFTSTLTLTLGTPTGVVLGTTTTNTLTIVFGPSVDTNATSLAINAGSINVTGLGFDATTPGNNIVTLSDGAQGTVTDATPTSLTVALTTPPMDLGPLTAVVTTNGVSNDPAVQVATISPVITSMTTSVAANVTTLTINGFGFDATTPGNNVVTFSNGAQGTVTSATRTSLTVSVTTPPSDTGPLAASVAVSGVSSGDPVQVATVVPVVKFAAASESVPQSAGAFAVTATLTGPVSPTAAIFAANRLNSPTALALDAAGNLYVANARDGTVIQVTPTGAASTFASGFNDPSGLAFDAAGNLYVVNQGDGTVSQVTPAGVAGTFASGLSNPVALAFDAAGDLYVANYFDGTVSQVTPAGVVSPFASGLSYPVALAFDAAGTLYVANQGDGTVSQVTPAGVVSPFVSGFNSPYGLAFDAAGNLYVASAGDGTVSQVTPDGAVSPFASGLNFPVALAFDAAGNLDVANLGDNTVSQVTPAGVVSPFVTGFSYPYGVAFDAAGNLYVANFNDNTVSRVTPAGVISRFASGFSLPTALAFDAAGNLYVANAGDGTVSQVTPAGAVGPFASGFSSPTGLAVDAAGNVYVANSDDGTVSQVTPAGAVGPFASGFSTPTGLAVGAAGNVYVANSDDGTVSQVTPAGAVSPFASGFSLPYGLAFDAAGNLYVANAGDGTVSQVTPDGVVSPFASGLSYPVALAFDAAGNLYGANFNDSTVSRVTSGVTVPFTLGGTAVDGTDYSGVTASPLTFGVGETTPGVRTATITGTLLSHPGVNSTLTFTLGTPEDAVLGSPSVNTLTILQPPPSYTGGNDAVTTTSGATRIFPLANDVSPSGAPLRLVGVSDPAIGIDGRSLIIPAGFTGTFTYTFTDGTTTGTASVTVKAGTPALHARTFSGLLRDAAGTIAGGADLTFAPNGRSVSVRLAAGTKVVRAKISLPAGTRSTSLGQLTVTRNQDGTTGVTLAAAHGNLTGSLVARHAPLANAYYTLALASTDVAIPGGGYAYVRTRQNAAAILIGRLPDGLIFNATTSLRDNETFSFYAIDRRANPPALVAGEIVLADLATTDLTGQWVWSKPPQAAGKRGLHLAGVETTLDAFGSLFTRGALPTGTGELHLSGGNLAASENHAVAVTAGRPAVPTGSLKSWTAYSKYGDFRVRISVPGLATPVAGEGYYLPKCHQAWGFFPGTSVGGRIVLTSP